MHQGKNMKAHSTAHIVKTSKDLNLAQNRRSVSFLLFSFLCFNISFAQTRAGVIEIPKNGVYQMVDDTLDVDNFILHDSATLRLNEAGSKTLIRAKRISIGIGCTILGKGEVGASGGAGKRGREVSGVCLNGQDGGSGTHGLAGKDGKNLTIEVQRLELAENLHIYLNGGNGGDGGKGGDGSAGSNSSAHCRSHGGNGGVGGNGGNGGLGGTLVINYAEGISVNDFCSKTTLHNNGGYQGLGGEGGRRGLRGHGSSEHLSDHGAHGKNGNDGKVGKEGRPLFYSVHLVGNK